MTKERARIKRLLDKPDEVGSKVIEKRAIRRRRFIPITRFPLHTYKGQLISSERRTLPTRRVDDIEAKELGSEGFIAGLR